MELRRYIAIFRRRLLLIIACAIVGLIAGYATVSRTSVYSAQAKIYVGPQVVSTTGFASNDALAGLEKVVQTYSVMIHSLPIAQDALKRNPGVQRSAPALLGATTAKPVLGTQLLTVSVSDTDPAAAQQLTNAMVDAFVDRIQTFNPSAPPEPGQPPRLPAYVFERAQFPGAPQGNGMSRHLILGGLFGLVIACAGALLLDYLDITVKSVADAERRLELPVLGVIPLERQMPAPTSRASSVLTT